MLPILRTVNLPLKAQKKIKRRMKKKRLKPPINIKPAVKTNAFTAGVLFFISKCGDNVV